MNKMMLGFALTLCLTSIGNAQVALDSSPSNQTFPVGGTSIAIPSPSHEMTEVGYQYRELMEAFVPPNNRLIAAFVQKNDLPELMAGSDLEMSRYALVQVSRAGEFVQFGQQEFQSIIDQFESSMDQVLESSLKDVEAELNRRIKMLDLQDNAVNLGQPIQLGQLFSKQDAFAFGLLTPVQMGSKNRKIAVASTLVRVNQRIIFAYLYSEYENEMTVKWLQQKAQQWADAILKANT